MDKKLYFLGAGILLLIIGIWIGVSLGGAATFSAPLASPAAESKIAALRKSEPAPDHEPARLSLSTLERADSLSEESDPDLSDSEDFRLDTKTADSDLYKVSRVIDGDTIELAAGERVRYIGIDAPETVDPRTTVQCYGREASQKNKELTDGKLVRLEKDITDQDKYRRLLRYIWADGILVNLELVRQGFAYASYYPPDIKYQDQFAAAERAAREEAIGLWGACPIKEQSALLEFSSNPNESADVSSLLCFIKGNINAQGEKIYHLPSCDYYARTIIDTSRGEQWFCSEEDAKSAGWRKALNCRE